MGKRIGITVVSIWFGLTAAVGSIPGQGRPLSDLHKTGKIQFVPEITITDNSMNGKEFFNMPNDIAVDARGRILVSDGPANNIKVFDPAGKYVKTIGKPGQGPGDFNYPSDVEVVGVRTYVRELMNGRISIFDGEDRYVSSVPTPREGGSWRSIRALPDGRFIVEKERVDRSRPNGPQEALLDLYSKELEFVKTVYMHEVWRNKYITEPQRTNVPLPFAGRVCWDLLPEGKIAIGYSGKYEIEILDPDKGKLSSFEHAYHPIEVTSRDKEEFFAGITYGYGSSSGGMATVSRGAPDYIRKLTEFPKTKPPFDGLKVDQGGNIWIQTSSAGEEDPSSFDAFDKTGAFLGAVRIVEGGTFPRIAVWVKDGFWTIRAGEDGEYAIVKMRIEAAK